MLAQFLVKEIPKHLDHGEDNTDQHGPVKRKRRSTDSSYQPPKSARLTDEGREPAVQSSPPTPEEPRVQVEPEPATKEVRRTALFSMSEASSDPSYHPPKSARLTDEGRESVAQPSPPTPEEPPELPTTEEVPRTALFSVPEPSLNPPQTLEVWISEGIAAVKLMSCRPLIPPGTHSTILRTLQSDKSHPVPDQMWAIEPSEWSDSIWLHV